MFVDEGVEGCGVEDRLLIPECESCLDVLKEEVVELNLC